MAVCAAYVARSRPEGWVVIEGLYGGDRLGSALRILRGENPGESFLRPRHLVQKRSVHFTALLRSKGGIFLMIW